jgi:hypothetical protein
VLWEELGDELLVFDSQRNRAHSLNSTAAAVWRACDGSRNVCDIARTCGLDEDVALLALERLRVRHLLEPEVASLHEERAVVSRRSLLRRGLVAGSALGVAVPVIRSISAPTPAMAASTHVNARNGQHCGSGFPGCSPGSACVFSLKGSFCLRSNGASCFHSAVLSHGSICSPSFGACPSTGVCP